MDSPRNWPKPIERQGITLSFPKTGRQLVVVDCETTHLDPEYGSILEVAAVNYDTDEAMHFVPYIDPNQLAMADPEAMAVNRYYERRVFRNMLTVDATRDQYRKFQAFLGGNTLAGMNPTFDLRFLERVMTPTWHYAPGDVGAYVAGALGEHPADVPKLEELAKRFGLEFTAHDAMEDVRVACALYRATMKLRGQ